MRNNYPMVMIESKSIYEKSKKIFYISAVERILSYVVPPHFFSSEETECHFYNKLPIVCWTPLKQPPFEVSFFLLCRFRENAYRFFYEMLSRWLIPGKRLNVCLQFAVDFSLPEMGSQKYIAGEVLVQIETDHEYAIMQKNLPIIESEIRLGVESAYQAGRILEIKGLTSDEKTALIQENIVSLIHHRPQDFDYDILSEMQHFLVLCKQEFKEKRCYRHMSRIICVHYLFRKTLKLSLEVYPERRYISVKLVRAKTLPRKKAVLGLIIGISYIRDNEIFEAEHILAGSKAIAKNIKLVPGSYFFNKSRSDPTCMMYLEIEKETAAGFSLEEERQLKFRLPNELKSRIEQRLNPIFMPQNEEEIVRHIVTLSHQLKFVKDLPQVTIDFNQQTKDSLEFLVVILRVATPGSNDILNHFKARFSTFRFIPDRIKTVGTIRKKYNKEASVFRVSVSKFPYLRKDHSLDLYKARQEVGKEIAKVIGEFRDYNGGIISKETEAFEILKAEVGSEHTFWLENFFYSIHPPIMRSILPSTVLKKMFWMLLETEIESLSEDMAYGVKICEKANYTYFLILAKSSDFQEILCQSIEGQEGIIASFFLPNFEYPSFGLIVEKECFTELKIIIENSMSTWSERLLLYN